uniref:Uncharacterized protein n=1 Tax=Daucus carota subsp. sativus TaxID=79200 RepID=A0A175YLR3_DAUCS
MNKFRRSTSKDDPLLWNLFNYQLPVMKEYVHPPKDESYFNQLIKETHIEDDVGTTKKTALHTQQKTNVQSPSCIPGSRNSVKRFPRKNVENIKPDTPPVSYSQCSRIFSPLTPLSPNIARPLQSPLPKHKPNALGQHTQRNKENVPTTRVKGNECLPEKRIHKQSSAFKENRPPTNIKRKALLKSCGSNIHSATQKRPCKNLDVKKMVSPAEHTIFTNLSSSKDKGKMVVENAIRPQHLRSEVDVMNLSEYDSDSSDAFSDQDFPEDFIDESHKFGPTVGTQSDRGVNNDLPPRKLNFDPKDSQQDSADHFNDLAIKVTAIQKMVI